MKTIEITVYDIDELWQQFPDGYKRAHSEFTESMWDTWGSGSVSDVMKMVADDAGCPLAGRFLEWDLYRGQIAYADGPLTHKEWEALMVWEPDIEASDLSLVVRGGMIEQDSDRYVDEKAEPLIDLINKQLRDLYEEMMGAARQEEMYLESEPYFREHCQTNDYTFESNGRMRNL